MCGCPIKFRHKLQSWDGVVGPWAKSPPNPSGSSTSTIGMDAVTLTSSGCVVGICMMRDKHCHNATSFLSQNSCVAPGCNWPSLPHSGPTTTMTCARRAEEILSRKVWWLMLFNSDSSRTLGGPNWVPNTFIPCCCVGNSRARQQQLGQMFLQPSAKQIFVLPGLRRMPASVFKTPCNVANTVVVLSRDVTPPKVRLAPNAGLCDGQGSRTKASWRHLALLPPPGGLCGWTPSLVPGPTD